MAPLDLTPPEAPARRPYVPRGHSKRYITLPALERRVPLGAYLAAVWCAKANPNIEFKSGLTTWWPTTGAEIVCQFRRGMQERITAGIPYIDRGRVSIARK